MTNKRVSLSIIVAAMILHAALVTAVEDVEPIKPELASIVNSINLDIPKVTVPGILDIGIAIDGSTYITKFLDTERDRSIWDRSSIDIQDGMQLTLDHIIKDLCILLDRNLSPQNPLSALEYVKVEMYGKKGKKIFESRLHWSQCSINKK